MIGASLERQREALHPVPDDADPAADDRLREIYRDGAVAAQILDDLSAEDAADICAEIAGEHGATIVRLIAASPTGWQTQLAALWDRELLAYCQVLAAQQYERVTGEPL